MKKLFSIFLSMILITGCSTTSTPDKEVSNNIKSQVTYINGVAVREAKRDYLIQHLFKIITKQFLLMLDMVMDMKMPA